MTEKTGGWDSELDPVVDEDGFVWVPTVNQKSYPLHEKITPARLVACVAAVLAGFGVAWALWSLQ